MSYADFCAHGHARRRRTGPGITIWRFTFRSMLRYGMLYADPHPGNYRFLPDGRVAFLDFGCVKELPPELVAGMKRYMGAALDGDWAEFDRALRRGARLRPRRRDLGPLPQLHHGADGAALQRRAVWQCSPEKAREHVQYLTRGLRELRQGARTASPRALRPQDAAGLHLREPPPVGPRLGAGRAPHRGRVPPAHRALGEGRARAHPGM